MRVRLRAALTGTVAACLLAAASSASAATEFGDACVADENKPGVPLTLFEVSAPGNPLPTLAPASGVLTGWKINLLPAVPTTIPTTLKVLRLDPATKRATAIGESTGNVVAGANAFPARVAIQAGDRIGISGPSAIGSLTCGTETSGTVGLMVSPFQGGPPSQYEEGSAKWRVPLVGVIEPDVDGDGYGDETQDGCPQSAAYQTACPAVAVETIDLAGSGSATVLVATSATAPVTVSGTVKLGGGKTAKLKGGTKTVLVGKFGHFKLKFSAKLKERLRELPPSEKLTLKVTAKATNVAGQVSTSKSKVKLKGQG